VQIGIQEPVEDQP